MSTVSSVESPNPRSIATDLPLPRAAPDNLPDDLVMRDDADPSSLAKLLTDSDNMTLLFAIQILNRDGQIELGKEGVELKKEEAERLFAKIQAAVKEAQEAAEKGGFFGALFDKFGVIAKVAVIVAAAASVLATGGASLVAIAALAGTLLSTFSKELASVAGGSELAEKIFSYGGMALSLAAGGAGIYQGVAGGARAIVSSDLASTIARVANYVQAGATAGQAGTGYVRDRYDAHALDARADETEGRADRTAALREMNQLIEMLKEVQKSFNKSNQTLRKAIDSQYAGNLTLATLGVRA